MINPTSSYYSRYENTVSERINNDILSGKISKADGSTLANVLGDIASSLQNESSSSGTATKFDPRHLRSKLNDLIDKEVAAGKLSNDQAAELRSILMPHGSGHKADGKKDSDGDAIKDQSGDANGTDTDEMMSIDVGTTGKVDTGGSSSAVDPLQAFLSILQDTEQQLQKANYGSNGKTENGQTSNKDPLLLDRQV